jgi:hypothetical protein
MLATPNESEDPVTGLAGLSATVGRPKLKPIWLQSGLYGLAAAMASCPFSDERPSEASYIYVVADIAQESAMSADGVRVLPSPIAPSAHAAMDRESSL